VDNPSVWLSASSKNRELFWFGVSTNFLMTDIDRKELIDELDYLSEQLNRTPTLFDIDEYSDYSPEDYLKTFSTLDEALVESGILEQYPVVPTMELVEDLYRVMDIVGRPPRTNEYEEFGEHAVNTYTKRFGYWPDALVAAGLEPATMGPHSKAQLKRKAKTLAKQVGGRPTLKQVELLMNIKPNEFTRHFGPWEKFLDELEIEE
jgi:hypothetical protein